MVAAISVARPAHGLSNGRASNFAGTFETRMIGMIHVKMNLKTPRNTATG